MGIIGYSTHRVTNRKKFINVVFSTKNQEQDNKKGDLVVLSAVKYSLCVQRLVGVYVVKWSARAEVGDPQTCPPNARVSGLPIMLARPSLRFISNLTPDSRKHILASLLPHLPGVSTINCYFK